MQYGNYVKTNGDNIQKAKDELLEGMIDTIRELAKQDEFWIIHRHDPSNPLSDILTHDGKDTTVGWKINIPHMGVRKPIQVIRDGEVIGEIRSGK